jgi:ferredoxin-fold anticodon binding domain-containing protein
LFERSKVAVRGVVEDGKETDEAEFGDVYASENLLESERVSVTLRIDLWLRSVE